jgi:hypothetical protein
MRALLIAGAFFAFATPVLAQSDTTSMNLESFSSTSSATTDDVSASDVLAPKMPLTGNNGSFSREIPIDVPQFRGLEPNLRLGYNSANGIREQSLPGGELGTGWTLAGVSAIQRISGSVSPARGHDKAPSARGTGAYGAPGFAADSFMLDGAELVPCAEVADQSSTPSCISGGTHSSRFETYLRIRRNNSANTWEVTGREGVKSVYSSLEMLSPDSTFRWYLSSVVDRRGNHVDYNWSCESGHCTIANVRAFNVGASNPAVEVIFYTEARLIASVMPTDVRSAQSRSASPRLRYATTPFAGLSTP